jgi:hypothetical protein
VNGLEYKEGKAFLVYPEKGKVRWMGPFKLEPSDIIQLQYNHICDNTCKQNRNKPSLRLSKSNTLKKKSAEARENGVKMFWRALFYSVLACIMIYAAHVPLWTIFFPMAADLLVSTVWRYFGEKPHKDLTHKYKGIIRLPHNRDKKKIKSWVKSLQNKGFKILDWDRKGIEFEGGRKLYQKHRKDEVLGLAYVPERPNLIREEKLNISSGDEAFVVQSSKSLMSSVKKLKKVRNSRTSTMSGESLTQSYVDSLYSNITEDSEFNSGSDPSYSKNKEVRQLSMGETGWVVPWAFVVSEDNGRMYIRRNYRVHANKVGTANTKIIRQIGGIVADFSEFNGDYSWPRDKGISKNFFNYMPVSEILP